MFCAIMMRISVLNDMLTGLRGANLEHRKFVKVVCILLWISVCSFEYFFFCFTLYPWFAAVK